MIELKGVTKRFGQETVLDQVDLRIQVEVVGLLGPNGSGKSTLLKCILGLLDFDGEISVNGMDVRRQSLQIKREMGYIPQSFALWSNLSVDEAIRVFGKLRGVGRQRQLALLEEFNLARHRSKTIRTLSGGMRQKLSIAVALLSDPGVLLLDEPTASLDAWATDEIHTILKGFQGKRTVILSTHRLEDVRAVAEKIVEIRAAKLIENDREAICVRSS